MNFPLLECVCCKNTDFEIYAKDSWLKLPVNRCKKCGLYVTGNSLNELETTLKQYYIKASDSQTRHEDLDNIIKLDFETRHGRYFLNQWKSHFEYCKEFFGLSKKLLEIGPGPGISLRMFEEKEFEVTGVDANEHCVEFLNSKLKKGKCIHGFIDDVEINKKFEIIWLSHCLEHMSKPHELLKKCKNLLSNNGFIFVAVPDCENETMLHQSIIDNASSFHFSKHTIQKIAENVGLHIVKVDSLRELYRFEGRFHIILNNKARRINKKLCPYYPFKVTKKQNGHEIRLILKK